MVSVAALALPAIQSTSSQQVRLRSTSLGDGAGMVGAMALDIFFYRQHSYMFDTRQAGAPAMDDR